MGVAFPFRARRRAAGAAVLWMMPVVVAAVVALALLPGALRHRLPDAPPLGQVWMATPNTVHFIQADDERVAQLFFGRPSSYVLSGGWGSATPALAWASASRFEVAVAQGRIPADVHTVMYDPEAWSATPIWERRHPDAAMGLFSETAREAGLPGRVDAAPLVGRGRRGDLHAAERGVGGRGVPAMPDHGACRRFRRRGRDPGAIPRVRSRAAYRALVVAAADQARAANAEVVVLAGLSTRFAANAQVLLNAWDAVNDVVDGHYMAVPEGIEPGDRGRLPARAGGERSMSLTRRSSECGCPSSPASPRASP